MTHHADIEAISRHIDRQIGRVHTVFHEIVSDDLHIDIHHVKSTLLRRYEVLVTSGMSAVPMAVPEGENQPRHAEVLTILPKGWPLTREAFDDERNYWPIRLMKDVARYPYYAKTWIGYGHTIANAESEQTPVPYVDSSDFCAALLMPPLSLGEAAWHLKRGGDDDIYFWAVVPLHREELLLKMEQGVDPLLDLFDKHRVTDRIDPRRPSVV